MQWAMIGAFGMQRTNSFHRTACVPENSGFQHDMADNIQY